MFVEQFRQVQADNQFTLDFSKMKFIISVQFGLILCWINFSFGFLQYPFLAKSLLNDFLSTVEVDQSISLKQMVHGVECNRECKPNDVKVCRFRFMIKYFQVMGG